MLQHQFIIEHAKNSETILNKYGRYLIMKSNGYKKYLKKQTITKYLVHLTQLLILIFLILLWQFLANHNLINTFITSSPNNILDTIINLYQTNNYSITFGLLFMKLLLAFL